MAGILEQLSKGLFGLAPIPAPNGVFGQVLDSAAQWGRGVQDKAANIQSTLADLIRNPSNALPNIPPEALANLLQQPVTPEQKQNIARKALDFGMEFGPLATVWHGSPHLFKKFDMSKIGTGEGAQAYGHGLYLAESPDVAKSYQTTLTADRGFNFGGKSGLTRQQIQDLVNEREGHKYLDGVIKPSGVADRVLDDVIYATKPANGLPRQYKQGSERAALYEKLRSEIQHTDNGALYKVDLPDEHIAKMLDWDKPLSQQPHVTAALKKLGVSFPGESAVAAAKSARESAFDAWAQSKKDGLSPLQQNGLYKQFQDALRFEDGVKAKINMTGADAIRGDLLKGVSDSNGMVLRPEEALRSKGIPGIRYLDGGSRAGGKGTSNFVVFSDEIPKIIGRE